jgi:hypothetical protein
VPNADAKVNKPKNYISVPKAKELLLLQGHLLNPKQINQTAPSLLWTGILSGV